MLDPMPDPDDCFGCKALREENARLRRGYDEYTGQIDPMKILSALHVAERERDEARAEVRRLRAIISPGDAAAFEEYMAAREVHWVAEVARLEGLILDWDEMDYDGDGRAAQALEVEARRIRAQREERCPYCANPIGDGSGGTCTAECHAKGDSCRCAQREEENTCGCGLYVHPKRRNPEAIHIADCEYAQREEGS